jgi:predicted ester cyclase
MSPSLLGAEHSSIRRPPFVVLRVSVMPSELENLAVARCWLESFWSRSWAAKAIDDLAAADIVLQFSLQMPLHGREEAKKFLVRIRDAFPDLEFHSTVMVADGDLVISGSECDGTHTGTAFMDDLIGDFPAHSGRKMHLPGTPILRIKDNKIVEDTTRMTWVTLLPRLRKATAYLGDEERGSVTST